MSDSGLGLETVDRHTCRQTDRDGTKRQHTTDPLAVAKRPPPTGHAPAAYHVTTLPVTPAVVVVAGWLVEGSEEGKGAWSEGIGKASEQTGQDTAR